MRAIAGVVRSEFFVKEVICFLCVLIVVDPIINIYSRVRILIDIIYIERERRKKTKYMRVNTMNAMKKCFLFKRPRRPTTDRQAYFLELDQIMQRHVDDSSCRNSTGSRRQTTTRAIRERSYRRYVARLLLLLPGYFGIKTFSAFYIII